jgi:septal ring factor EnvC (AmiA/AmiB activator)
LDNEQIIEQFETIEKKVERVIKAIKTYEASNRNLKDKIQHLEEELQSRVAAEKRYQEERTVIRSKIDDLLAKLDHLPDVEFDDKGNPR